MPEKLPVVFSAHHASDNFGEFSDRCALNSEQRRKFSDYGTAETVPRDGVLNMVAEASRGLVNLNASSDEPEKLFRNQDFAKPTPNDIWLPGRAPMDPERADIVSRYYSKYHGALLDKVRGFQRPSIVVAWDNTAHYQISEKKTGEDEMMKPVILSNKGTRDSADKVDPSEIRAFGEEGKQTTCDPRFLDEFRYQLRRALKEVELDKYADEIYFNRVYKGGHVAEHYNTRRHPKELDTDYAVQSLQFEYDTAITHNQETLEANPEVMTKLRIAVERAMYRTYVNLLTHNVFWTPVPDSVRERLGVNDFWGDRGEEG